MKPHQQPTLRKPAGMLLILGLIALLGYGLASYSDVIGRQPVLLQALIYLIAGTVWIAPLGPLLRWMETGKWRE
jgi:predicted membrane channel-forming protein YqfA (hemolysin III family)